MKNESSQNTRIYRTSDSLIRQIQDGQQDAWNRFVELYSPLVYHWCHAAGLASYDIPDMFQEIFSTVARKIGKFQSRENRGSFRSWLRTLTRNKLIDFYRKESGKPNPEGGTDARRKMEQVIAVDIGGSSCINRSAQQWLLSEKSLTFDVLFQTIIPKVKTQFKPQTWQAFWSVVVEGSSPGEVAEKLGLSPSTVRVAKCRVLSRLRKELGEIK